MNQVSLSTDFDTTTPSLPRTGWIRLRRKAETTRRKGHEAASLFESSISYQVPVTRWIE
jgi:hypothetical protein